MFAPANAQILNSAEGKQSTDEHKLFAMRIDMNNKVAIQQEEETKRKQKHVVPMPDDELFIDQVEVSLPLFSST